MNTEMAAVVLWAATVVLTGLNIAIIYILNRKHIGLLTQSIKNDSDNSLEQIALLNYQSYFAYQLNKRKAALDYSITVNPQIREAFDVLDDRFGHLLFRGQKISREELEAAFDGPIHDEIPKSEDEIKSAV